MKSAVETLNPTRVKLTVEVPFEELQPSLDEAYKTIAAQVNIPGFRKGKVPPRIIDQRVGRGAVIEEAMNDALPRFYSQAVDETNIRPLGRPEVDITEVPTEAGSGLKFTAEVDVRPEITLPDMSTVTITVDDVAVADDDVAERLDSLRERFGTLNTVERAVAEADFVTLDLVAAIDDEEIDRAAGLSYQVGSGTMIEGIDGAITGLSAGQDATFTTALTGGEHAGKDAQITVTVTAVKERSLPDLDDDFAQLASEFDTLEELRADAVKQVQAQKTFGQGLQARERLVEHLLENVPFEVPASVVTDEVEQHFASGHEGDEDQSEHRAEVETNTVKALRTQLLLDTVVEANNIQIQQSELIEYLVMAAQQYGMSPNDFAAAVDQAGQVPAMASEVMRRKALALLLSQINVVDESGNPVVLDDVLGNDEDDERADAVAPAPSTATDPTAVPTFDVPLD